MNDCPVCGGPRENQHARGPLLTRLNPPGAWWHGKPLRLQPRQLQTLDLLCKLGRASHLAMQIVGTGEDANPETVRVMLTHLRKRLPAGIAIISIRGWGYELIIDGDDHEPR